MMIMMKMTAMMTTTTRNKKRVLKDAQNRQISLFNFVLTNVFLIARVGEGPELPPVADHGHELGYVFVQREGCPKADNGGAGEKKLDENFMRTR